MGQFLGLFTAFGILTKHQIKDKLTLCLFSGAHYHLCTKHLSRKKAEYAYQIGIEVLIINGIITFFRTLLIRKK